MSKSWSTAPLTVKAFVAVTFINPLIGLLGAEGLINDMRASVRQSNPSADPAATDAILALVPAMFITTMLFGLAVSLFLAYKLVKGKYWAWLVLLVLGVMAALSGLASLLQGGVTQVITALITFLGLYLLLRAETRLYVKKSNDQEWVSNRDLKDAEDPPYPQYPPPHSSNDPGPTS